MAQKTVKDYIRPIADFPHEGIMFRDVTTLFAGTPARLISSALLAVWGPGFVLLLLHEYVLCGP